MLIHVNEYQCMSMHGNAGSRTSTRLNPMPVSSLCMEVTVTLRVLHCCDTQKWPLKIGVYSNGSTQMREYSVAKTHWMPYLSRLFSAKEPYDYWLLYGNCPAIGRAASGGALALEPPRHRGET